MDEPNGIIQQHQPPAPPPCDLPCQDLLAVHNSMGEPNGIIEQHEPQQPAAPYKLPCQDLLTDDRRRDFIDICVPLTEASMKGDWITAKYIIGSYKYILRCGITENCETALHVASSAQSNTDSIEFVRHLVGKMSKEELQLQNINGNTALCLAAAAGNVEIAKIMVTKNKNLPSIPNGEKMMPLCIAVLFGHKEMADYLYEESQHMNALNWTDANRTWVFSKSIELDLFDFALKILEEHPTLAQNAIALGALARKPSAFDEIKPHCIRSIVNSSFCLKVEPVESEAMRLLEAIWKSLEDKPKDEIDELLKGPTVVVDKIKTHPSRILFVAAAMGNTRFLATLIRKYPDLIWKKNDNNQSIFHVAVSHRHESIYNLLYEIGSMKGLIIPYRDSEDNNMLHLVGKKAEKSRFQHVSGAAFRLQLDLLWFKEVETMVPPLYKEQKNKSGFTPYELFTENKKSLVNEGENWMKGTASKCMVVAALIATVVFAVAYTIPGGYEQKEGFPMFLHNAPFIVFVVLDAISLILSSTSILVFLSILTSRYTQEDFLESLPKKLLVGLSMLFLAIVTMMISFSVSFFVIYRNKFIAVPVFISVVALIPSVSYAKLQYPLLKDVFRSTYGSKHFFKPKKQMLYYQNPRV